MINTNYLQHIWCWSFWNLILKKMKTTTNLLVAKKLSKLAEKGLINKSSKIYGWIEDVQYGQIKFRPVYTMGSTWKYTTLNDKSMEFKKFLNLLKIEFVEGNDAPKNGRTGYFLIITTKIKQN